MKLIPVLLIIKALFLFDESKGELFSVRDMCESGYSDFANMIMEIGHEVRVNQRPIIEALQMIEPEKTVLIFPPSSYNPVNGLEFERIKDFINRGGSLLVIGEHFGFSQRMQVLSASIAGPFGYEFVDG